MKTKPESQVIFDLDGTLALIDHRRPILDDKSVPSEKRWRDFFAACVDDEPNHPVITTLRALHKLGYYIIIFSGRSDEVKQQTLEWLEKYGVLFHELTMRKAGDFTPDEELKKSWLADLDKENILCVFDDRAKVVSMWREEGLTCFQVAPGDF